MFILKKNLNAFRRNVTDKIKQILTQNNRKELTPIKIEKPSKAIDFIDFVFVENYKNVPNETNVIYSPEEYTVGDVLSFKKWAKDNKKIPYLDLPNFALEKDIKLLKEIVEKTKINVVANNYYALTFDTEKIIGGGLNVYNSFTASEFNLPVISAESDNFNRHNFAYMTLRHCPLKSHANGNCKNCPYTDGYTLTMDSGKVMKIKRKKLSTCTFYLTD